MKMIVTWIVCADSTQIAARCVKTSFDWIEITTLTGQRHLCALADISSISLVNDDDAAYVSARASGTWLP